MAAGITTIAGIEIPSTSPIFLAIVGFHILLGLTCVVTGFVAMVSPKRHGRHSRFGTIYYWCLVVLFASATALSAMRWAENYHLFILGVLSFGTAVFGRVAVRQPSPARRLRLHVSGMGLSYILMLTAFYVDNGRNLPLWKGMLAGGLAGSSALVITTPMELIKIQLQRKFEFSNIHFF